MVPPVVVVLDKFAERRLELLLGLAAVLAISLLLFIAFWSGRDALLVMINLPLALIGGVIGVFAAGDIVSVTAIIRFIAVFAIATHNGIMMAAHFHPLHDNEGIHDIVRFVRLGDLERLTPTFLTALAAL